MRIGAVQRAGIQPYDVEEVYLGNVLSAGSVLPLIPSPCS